MDKVLITPVESRAELVLATSLMIGIPFVFWMWVTAFFGMGLKYAECLLALNLSISPKYC